MYALSDTNLTVRDPEEDIRSRKVVDAKGHDLGEVDDLIIDDREHRVRFVRGATDWCELHFDQNGRIRQ